MVLNSDFLHIRKVSIKNNTNNTKVKKYYVQTMIYFQKLNMINLYYFLENQIQIKHLSKMTEFTLEKQIPTAGERIDFMECLQQYNNRQSQVNIKKTYW